VTHENFLRPGGHETHDVAHCLDLIDAASLALDKRLAPISPQNRATVADWLAARPDQSHWSVLPEDWFNICDFPLVPPTPAPRDRRGRHSRPGLEKFPSLADLDLCFPRHAEANVILGADLLADAVRTRPHWQAFSFDALDLADYFSRIDFMVYFTAPTFRESFGRVLAEAIAAGKVVISDAETAAPFGDAVLAARPDAVDGLIAGFVARPDRYAAQVRRAQAHLAAYSSDAFLRRHALRQRAEAPA
jgi:glycosyltransferase involved in cell wall biosynthesis